MSVTRRAALQRLIMGTEDEVTRLEKEAHDIIDAAYKKTQPLREKAADHRQSIKEWKDELRSLAPKRTKEEMAAHVRKVILALLRKHRRVKFTVRTVIESLPDVALEYVGHGFENRVRKALDELWKAGEIQSEDVTVKDTSRVAYLWWAE